MKLKKLWALLLAGSMTLGLAACGGDSGSNSGGGSGSNGGGSGANSMSVCIASEPDTIDPALNSAVDGATLLVHLFSGLAKWEENAEGNLEIVPDAAESLPEPEANSDGTVTYTYTLREGLKWSDGQDLTAKDFEFAWKRAVDPNTGSDYAYMYDVVVGYADIWATEPTGEVDENGDPVEDFINPDPEQLAVEATDDRTLVVTLTNPVSYWDQLLAFPVYFPVREDVVSDESWATNPGTYVCNGPYSLTGWEHNSVMTLTKNPNFIDADTILMDELKFYLSDDQNNMLTNFQAGDWMLIDDVPTNEISTLKTQYPDEFVVAGQIGCYYFCWNINENILPASSTLTGAEAEAAKAEVRRALTLLLDRNYIVEEIAQGGQVPASSFVPMGMANPDGSEFYETAGHNDGYPGYYPVSSDSIQANFDEAVEVLKKYYTFDEATQTFTDFPTMTCLYNTADSHKAISEYFQSAFAGVGISMNLENQEWNTFLNTRKAGNYSIARNGWLADYSDPICFIDMWTTNSGNNDIQYGKGSHANLAMYNLDLTPYGYDINVTNGTWAQTYDVLVSTIKSCTDEETRFELMHLAEDMLMDTGCLIPLYFYTDIYMLNNSVDGFFSNPLGYKYFMYCTIS